MRPQLSKQNYFQIPLLAGLLPVVAVATAYLINISQTDIPSCVPFWSGCVSISRAARSGPGLLVFKTLALPGAAFMVLSWVSVARWAREYGLASARMTTLLVWLGLCASAFMAVYVFNLGLDGIVYRFMRRFGVSLFFGFTVVNQLLLIRMSWPHKARLPSGARKPLLLFTLAVSLEWLIGVGTTAKRAVFTDPDLLDRLEKISEWWFALLLVCSFCLLSWILAGKKSAGD